MKRDLDKWQPIVDDYWIKHPIKFIYAEEAEPGMMLLRCMQQQTRLTFLYDLNEERVIGDWSGW